MSPSTKSNPASDASPATGSAVDPGDAAPEGSKELAGTPEEQAQVAAENTEREAIAKGKPVAVSFEASRQRPAWWVALGIPFGALLIWKLGTVGVWVGVVLVMIGLFRAFELLQTFLHPAGTIEVTDSRVTLPRGRFMPAPLRVAPGEVTSVYFLRRSVPWNRSAPVLVVELGDKALAYPRDWFASEADQRHVVHALLRNAKKTGVPVPAETAPRHDEGNAIMWAQLLGGVALLVGGLVAWMAASTPISNATYVLFIAPIVAGWMFAWRGLLRW